MPEDAEIKSLIEALNPHDSLLTVATRIGNLCLENRTPIEWDDYVRSGDLAVDLTHDLAAELSSWWTETGESTNISPADVASIIGPFWLTPALAYSVALNALCQGPLTDYFNWTGEIIELVKGSVFPLPTRRLPWSNTPPNPKGTTHQDRLCPDGYKIWEHDRVVRLNYKQRDLLDHVCWRPVETTTGTSHSLPKIAAVSPLSTDEMNIPTHDPGRTTVFNAGPSARIAPDRDLDSVLLERVYDALRRARSAEGEPDIAVLPECCLHKATLLEQLDDEAWKLLPSLIVAGSAHEQIDGNNHNRSITYLMGAELIVHSKRIPYRQRGTIENIAPRTNEPITVACGTATRLAVAICADLNTSELVQIFDALGVNLLLVVAWTPKEGTFGGALGALAAYCQCVALVANGPQQSSWEHAEWFYAMSIVPRERPRPEVHTPPSSLQPYAGILDPNLEPGQERYWTWI